MSQASGRPGRMTNRRPLDGAQAPNMHIPDARDRDLARRYFQRFIGRFAGCERVLDIASGRGHLLELFKEAGIGAVGVELDRELFEQAKAKGLDVIQADLFEFLAKSPASSFDGAVASHIVEHFPPQRVEELFRLLCPALKPGSLFLVLTPNIAHVRSAAGDFWRDPTHVRPYPVQALAKLFARTGWKMVEGGEHAKRAPSLGRTLRYGFRNLLFGRLWVKDDVYAIATPAA